MSCILAARAACEQMQQHLLAPGSRSAIAEGGSLLHPSLQVVHEGVQQDAASVACPSVQQTSM